MSAANQLDLTT
jgi:hypothetical protein